MVPDCHRGGVLLLLWVAFHGCLASSSSGGAEEMEGGE
jgi:hypothetical protein